MRAAAIHSAAISGEGNLSIGFSSATDTHTLELSRKAQEQLLPALLASDPADLQKFFTAGDLQVHPLAEGRLLVFTIQAGIAVRVLVGDSLRRKLLDALA